MFSTLFTSAGITTVISAILRLWSQKQSDIHEREMILLENSRQLETNRQNARQVRDGKTKKVIALMIASVYVLLKISPLILLAFGITLDVSFSWYEWSRGFWFLTDGKEILKTITVRGIHFTPLDAEILGMIIGYYFGGSLAKRR